MLDAGEAEHILNPQPGDEEHRITYVALSRAKLELFIHCPEPSFHDRFAALGLNVVRVADPTPAAAGRAAPKRRRKASS